MTERNDPTPSVCEMADYVRLRVEQESELDGPGRLPFVTMTYAQSLDGSIAKSEGETTILSNPYSQRLTHQVRAVHDAILVGINTVLRDDPRLNVRLVEGESPQPIVVDSRLRFPMDANLLRDPCIRPIIFTHPDSCEKKEKQLQDRGATVLRIGGRRDGWIELAELLAYLKSMGLRSVMVEGGASIITSVLRSRLANQVLLTISARFLGGLPSMHRMHGDDAYHPPQLENLKYQWLGNDLILCGDLVPLDTTPPCEVAICDRAASPSTLLSKSTSGEGGTL